MKRALTDAVVTRLKPPAKGQVDHFDRGFPGLALRISYGGKRAWTLFYRIGEKQRRATLGTYPAMSLAEARTVWRQARADIEVGRDPNVTKQNAPSGLFADVVLEWLAKDQAENRTRAEVARTVNKELLPAWGHRQTKDIGRRDVLDVLDAIVERGSPVQARRTLSYIHRLFKWAAGRGIVETNPVANIPKPGTEVSRKRVLIEKEPCKEPYKELLAVWRAAQKTGYPFGPIIRLLILTGARRDEIAELRWQEIGETGISLSGSRTKNGEAHEIALTPLALEILKTLPRIKGCDFVFSTTGQTAVSGWSRAKANLDKLSGVSDWRIHDLRRTVATGLQRLGVRLEAVEAVLGHVSGSRAGVVGIYQRYDFEAEARAALTAWGEHVLHLGDPQKSADVLPMSRGRQ
jgi:integrase